jgi:mannitol/fructose-specific phosphotransferase system IIA component (Ntr-type)
VLTESEVTLCPDEIVLNLDASSRQQAIERAATLLAAARHLDPALVFRALWRREQAGSTALGKGIAIPHARVAGITAPAVLFCARGEADRLSGLRWQSRFHPLCHAGPR